MKWLRSIFSKPIVKRKKAEIIKLLAEVNWACGGEDC